MLRNASILVLVTLMALVTSEKCKKLDCDCNLAAKVYTINCTRKGLTRLPLEKNLPLVQGAEEIQLILAHNKLNNVSYPRGYNRKNVTLLDISNNSMTHFNVSAFIDTKSLKTLIVKNNSLTKFSNVTVKALKKISKVDLTNNQWNCTCEDRVFLKTLTDMDHDVRCSNGKLVESVLDFCPVFPGVLMLVLLLVLMIDIIIGMALAFYYT